MTEEILKFLGWSISFHQENISCLEDYFLSVLRIKIRILHIKARIFFRSCPEDFKNVSFSSWLKNFLFCRQFEEGREILKT